MAVGKLGTVRPEQFTEKTKPILAISANGCAENWSWKKARLSFERTLSNGSPRSEQRRVLDRKEAMKSTQVLICDGCGPENWNLASEGMWWTQTSYPYVTDFVLARLHGQLWPSNCLTGNCTIDCGLPARLKSVICGYQVGVQCTKVKDGLAAMQQPFPLCLQAERLRGLIG